MVDSDNNTTSGIPNALDFSMPSHFVDYKEISSRSYCVLYRAQRYGRWYVLKGLRPEYRRDPLYMSLLEKEFSVAVGLDHPNIVHIYSHETDDVVGPCLVMEYVDGRTLDVFLREKPSPSLRRKIAFQLLGAMDYYHRRQLVHRDLKPRNILVTRNGDNVKLIDFGLADGDDYAVLKEPAYTEGYASPEQKKAGVSVDCRTDLYAFGILLRQLFPHRYRRVSSRCTRQNPDKRYVSAAAVQHAIRRLPVFNIFFVFLIVFFIFAMTWYATFRERPQSIMPIEEKRADVSDTCSNLSADSNGSECQEKENVIKKLQLVPLNFEKLEMQRFADCLRNDFRKQMVGVDSRIAEAMVDKSEMQLSIKLMELMSGIATCNEAQWDSCWYELNNIQSATIKGMKADIKTLHLAETSKDFEQEVERISTEMELLNKQFQPLYHDIMKHRGDHFKE